jgi:hypothetical protein
VRLETALVLAFPLACACTSALGLDDAEFESVEVPAACRPKTIPERPASSEISGSDVFVVATRQLEFGDSKDPNRPRYDEIGFDLDGVCTHEPTERGCSPPSWETTLQPDGPGGVDNVVGRALYDTGAQITQSQIAIEGIESGLATALFRVRGYNGLSDDDEVEVIAYTGSTSEDPPSLYDGSGSLGLKPQWHGYDRWYVYPNLLVPPATDTAPHFVDQPKYFDSRAYVSNGTLVARLDELLLSTGLMTKVVIAAEIVRQDSGWRLTRGVLAGRMHIDSGLARFSVFPNPDNPSEPFCRNSSQYELYKRRHCATADISYRSDDPSAPCDGNSWAWRFETWPALLAGVAADKEYAFDRCSDPDRPANDSCETR